jgi:V/A-type H+-transporting ATPase subunit I
VASEVLEHLEKHAEKHEVHIKATPITDHETLVILEGIADQSDWVESIFMVFDVRKIPLAGGGSQGQNALAEEERALESLITALPGDGSFDSRIKVIEEAHKVEAASMDEKIKAAEASTHAPANPDAELLAQESKALGEIGFTLKVLLFASNESILVKRTRFYSILQGWTPDGRLEELKAAVKSVTDKTNGKIIVEVEDPSSSDKGVPMLAPRLGSVLQPIWRLTTLRGWPTPTELNPAHISIFIFALQFGLMFGDIGQGALILLLGLFLTRKTKRGLMGRIGTLFLPMGISAIIFGVLYDSIFLKEYLLRDLFGWKHPLPNPVTNTIQLFVLIFQLAVVEVTFGLILNAYNQVVKQKNIAGALGDRGLGMFLYVYAIYSAVDVSKGLQPKADLSPILPYMAAGLALSFAEPIIHALLSGHRPGMTQFGEGVGGLMMTFVEGLANLFSFLRVGAFALAHASLGVAAIKLGEAMTLNIGGMNIMPIIGYIVMNMIAMSFELISSTVQSLRLLYYEFMGKFYSGQGTPFVPYTSSEPKNGAVQKQ